MLSGERRGLWSSSHAQGMSPRLACALAAGRGKPLLSGIPGTLGLLWNSENCGEEHGADRVMRKNSPVWPSCGTHDRISWGCVGNRPPERRCPRVIHMMGLKTSASRTWAPKAVVDDATV